MPVSDAVSGSLADFRARVSSDADSVAKHARDLAESTKATLGIFWAVSPQPAGAPHRGPLAGIPFGVKDNVEVAGLPTTSGTPALFGSIPAHDAEVVARIRDAGADMIGKVGMHELALGTTSNNGACGPVRNPLDPTRVPGGSSGGSAAAVAAGVVPFSIGTDTGGSMRIPAAFCGVVGMRPTSGRYPGYGVIMISPTRDTSGIFAHTVTDVAEVDAIITGDTALASIPAEKLRLGIPRPGFFDVLSTEVRAATEEAISAFARAGVTLVETEVVGAHELAEFAGFPIVAYETVTGFDTYLKTLPEPFGSLTIFDVAAQVASPDVEAVLDHMLAEPVSLALYAEALAARDKLTAAYATALTKDTLDALIYPTVPVTAPVVGETTVDVDGVILPLFPTTIRNTDPGSLTGQPSLSIPLPRTAGGLPIGLGIEGALGADRHILAVAVTLEEILARS
ncbi:MAG: indole acetimide hydrolase [Actinomycetales bacterium]|nr:indole acetimide hydrolase [Actinomycetales bacterium]